jgi:hypothetical protein
MMTLSTSFMMSMSSSELQVWRNWTVWELMAQFVYTDERSDGKRFRRLPGGDAIRAHNEWRLKSFGKSLPIAAGILGTGCLGCGDGVSAIGDAAEVCHCHQP